MAETVAALEAKNRFSELMERVAHTSKRIVVVRRGKPMMAMVPMADLLRLEELEDAQAREERADAVHQLLAEADRIRSWWLEKLEGRPLPSAADLLREARQESLE